MSIVSVMLCEVIQEGWVHDHNHDQATGHGSWTSWCRQGLPTTWACAILDWDFHDLLKKSCADVSRFVYIHDAMSSHWKISSSSHQKCIRHRKSHHSHIMYEAFGLAAARKSVLAMHVENEYENENEKSQCSSKISETSYCSVKTNKTLQRNSKNQYSITVLHIKHRFTYGAARNQWNVMLHLEY